MTMTSVPTRPTPQLAATALATALRARMRGLALACWRLSVAPQPSTPSLAWMVSGVLQQLGVWVSDQAGITGSAFTWIHHLHCAALLSLNPLPHPCHASA